MSLLLSLSGLHCTIYVYIWWHIMVQYTYGAVYSTPKPENHLKLHTGEKDTFDLMLHRKPELAIKLKMSS